MTRDALPPLNALRAFDAVCREGSVSGTARALHVSQSAISRHIARLEEELGCRLFERRASGMALTEAGRELNAASAPALQQLRDASRRLRTSSAGVQTLRVVSLASFALRWLTPRLPSFQGASPGIALDLRIADGQAAFEHGQSDCAIVSEAPTSDTATAIDLFAEQLVVIGAPQRREHPAASGASGERCGPLIHVSSRPELWGEWARHHHDFPLDPTQIGLAFQDFYIAIGAAVAGAGLALVPDVLVAHELRTGTLVEPFAHRLRTGRHYRLLLAPGHDADPAVRDFATWLQRQIDSDRQEVG